MMKRRFFFNVRYEREMRFLTHARTHALSDDDDDDDDDDCDGCDGCDG